MLIIMTDTFPPPLRFLTFIHVPFFTVLFRRKSGIAFFVATLSVKLLVRFLFVLTRINQRIVHEACQILQFPELYHNQLAEFSIIQKKMREMFVLVRTSCLLKTEFMRKEDFSGVGIGVWINME